VKIVTVIPARMGSSRFPGKPLADICGLPMIEHVRRRAELNTQISEVIVATCDQEIYAKVIDYGGKAVMTSETHVRCTDRVAEVAAGIDADVIVNLQGDEPLFMPELLDPLLSPLEDKNVLCTNLMEKMYDIDEFRSKNAVKVVCNNKNEALYFSRSPIPHGDYGTIEGPYKQLGVIAFRKDFLLKFSSLPPTPLEKAESVDMLRALEHGFQIRMVLSPFISRGVDTPDDLEDVAERMKTDTLYLKKY